MANGRRLFVDLCRAIDSARRATGMSYAALGRAVGISGDQAARICRGEARTVSIERLAGLLAAVGLALSASTFPAGDPIRDAGHLALLARLQRRVAATLRWATEVPVIARPAAAGFVGAATIDQRAWDAVVTGRGWAVGIEAETRLGDIQALERRLGLKQRDGVVDAVILLVNDTAHNRQVLAAEDVSLRNRFPGSPRVVLRCLGDGVRPPASAILVL